MVSKQSITECTFVVVFVILRLWLRVWDCVFVILCLWLCACDCVCGWSVCGGVLCLCIVVVLCWLCIVSCVFVGTLRSGSAHCDPALAVEVR